MDDDTLLTILRETADSVHRALAGVSDWSPGTGRPGQYDIDVVADEAAVGILVSAGVSVLSEESGRHHPERPITVVVDPVDGSTNASRGLAWYATSLCAVDHGGPRVAVVVNQANGERFEAVRGGGSRLDGRPIRPSPCDDIGDAIVGVSGVPDADWGFRQYRALGAMALDLCAVACGRLDGYVDASPDAHGPWDYLGALLVCREAGAVMADAVGRELVTLEHGDRRTPMAAGTSALLDQLLEVRRGG